jgi:hypothetical protein
MIAGLHLFAKYKKIKGSSLNLWQKAAIIAKIVEYILYFF